MIHFVFLFILIYAPPLPAETKCDTIKFYFGDQSWTLPTIVEEAYHKHKLSYKPPGYYYSVDKKATKVILDYHSEALDFDDEYQAKEVLFPRKVHSFIFQIPENTGTYDSLIHVLERSFKSSFALRKGRKEGVTLLEHERPFEYYFLNVDKCLTVGIKKSLSENHKNIVTVRFMYGLSEGRMGTIMGSY